MGQGEPPSRISRSKVTLFEDYRTNTETHRQWTDRSTGTTEWSVIS